MNRARIKQKAQSEATVEHRRREDAAPRLRDEITNLLALRFQFTDVRAEGRVLAASYARPIAVASAPAHFEIACLERRCDGRHDLTRRVMAGLHESEACFGGTSECDGTVGEDMPCDRVLAYVCEASYRK